MNTGPEWCTIESDPGVFTELISKFGVKDVQVEELWGLDDTDYNRLKPMHGLIFLFKWDKSIETEISSNVLDMVPEGVFFAKQIVNNACATQAILSILLNCPKTIELGDTLNTFLDFTKDLDPESIGIALGNQEKIRLAHNSFSRPEPIQIERTKDDEEGEAFHFISYVRVNGFLYEIDGLQKGPRLIDSCTQNDWFGKARNVLQQRMASYQSKELRFTLLSVGKNLKNKYLTETNLLKSKKDGNLMDTDNDNELNEYINNFPADQIDDRLNELDKLMENESIKFKKWERENVRRRHNYFPFILNLIRVSGQNNLLGDLTERATQKKKQKLKNAQQEKK
eukprot:33518_1